MTMLGLSPVNACTVTLEMIAPTPKQAGGRRSRNDASRIENEFKLLQTNKRRWTVKTVIMGMEKMRGMTKQSKRGNITQYDIDMEFSEL